MYQAKDDRVAITDVGTMVTQHNDGQHTLTNVSSQIPRSAMDEAPAH